MIQTHGGHYQPSPPLTFDDAIYWPEPAVYVEWRIDPHMLRDAAFDARAYAEDALRRTGEREIAKQKLGWFHYVTVPSERAEDWMIVVRHTLYEQPGYRKLNLFRAPLVWTTFHRFDDTTHQVVDLPLRRLMYHDERVRGALYDDVLYVVLPS